MNHGYQTAFEILGVAEDATTEQIRQRYAEVVAAHGFDENAVPRRIRDAFAQLGTPGDRSGYVETLAACREDRTLLIAPEDVREFRRVCTLWQIFFFEDRYRTDGLYYVWQPTQPEPEAVRVQRAAEQAARPGQDPFALRRRLRKLAAPALLVTAVLLAGWGWSSWSEYTAQRRQVELRQQLGDAVALAEQQLATVEKDRSAVYAGFERLTGFPLTAATRDTPRPRALDLSLIRHESVRQAWDALLEERAATRDPAQDQAVLQTARQRLTEPPLSASDLAPIERINRDLAARGKQLALQQANLTHIREMLEADRLEKLLKDTGSDSP
ncbi:MAG: hypothetical protein AMXMBFR47_36380 [Planctomycetota bacterium]